MSIEQKTFAAYSVLTADDVNNYLMNQAVVQVDTVAELTNVPTTIKTAWTADTGTLWVSNAAGVWVAVDTNPRFLGSTISADMTANSAATTAASLSVTIPAGLATGARIKVRGYGLVSTASGVGVVVEVDSSTGGSATRAASVGSLGGDFGVTLFDSDLTAGSRTYTLKYRATVSGQTAAIKAPTLEVEIC